MSVSQNKNLTDVYSEYEFADSNSELPGKFNTNAH
jgi:hypothetical protein